VALLDNWHQVCSVEVSRTAKLEAEAEAAAEGLVDLWDRLLLDSSAVETNHLVDNNTKVVPHTQLEALEE
jgi:hypothetical protein